MIFGERDLRALNRDMGSPVSFEGVSKYPDGATVKGLFDRPVSFGLMSGGIGGVEVAKPTIRLPFNAFARMPQDGDTITIDGTEYTVNQPTEEDDGAIFCYDLRVTG